MSDFATWPIFVGFVCGVALYLAVRNSPLHRNLNAAKPATEVSIKIKEDALREVMGICTPVFLGFSITHAFPPRGEIDDPSQVFQIMFLVGYIIIWLWMQRDLFRHLAYFLRRYETEQYDRWKMIIIGVQTVYWLFFLYFVWFILTVGSPAFAPTLAIFLIDLVAQIIIVVYLWGRVRKGRSVPSV